MNVNIMKIHTVVRCLVCFVNLLLLVTAKVGFQKDDDMDFEFPPNVAQKPSSQIPLGHLRPIGWQRKPDGKISEEKTIFTPSDFWHKHVKHNQPATFLGAVKGSKVISLWTDDYLRDNYGNSDVEVTMKKEQAVLRQAHYKVMRMKMKKFLKEYKYEDWYLSTIVPQEMIGDLVLPKMLQCSDMKSNLMESELWMSAGGTSSTLHYHADHDLHCLLDGRKDFIFIDPKHKTDFTTVERSPKSGSGYSTLDLEMVNMFKQSQIADIPWKYTSIRSGDCVFIPAGLLHQVRSYGRSLSFTIHWAPTSSVSFNDCKTEKLKATVALSEASFMWTYVRGEKQLSNIRLHPESLKHHLTLLIRTDDKLHFERFNAVYKQVVAKTRKPLKGQTVFKILDPTKQGYITRDEILKLDNKKLQAVADIFNSAHKPIRDEL